MRTYLGIGPPGRPRREALARPPRSVLVVHRRALGEASLLARRLVPVVVPLVGVVDVVLPAPELAGGDARGAALGQYRGGRHERVRHQGVVSVASVPRQMSVLLVQGRRRDAGGEGYRRRRVLRVMLVRRPDDVAGVGHRLVGQPLRRPTSLLCHFVLGRLSRPNSGN